MSASNDPNAALQALLGGAGLTAPLFPPTSRYHGLEIVATMQRPDGTTLVYLRRRFISPPERFALLQEHVVAEGERLDNLAAALPRRPGAVLAALRRQRGAGAGGAGNAGPGRCGSPCRKGYRARQEVSDMLKGINLTLMIGPAVPVPVPQDVLDALTERAGRHHGGETASGFELTFKLSKNSPLQTIFLLSGGASIPLVRVIIAVTVNGTPEVLMDGVMTQHEVGPGDDPDHFSLTIKGKDLTAVMDYIDFSGIPYPAMPDFARVALILAKYAVFGIVPMVIPSVLIDVPIPVERIPTQQGKDLPYIKELAEEVGLHLLPRTGPARRG